MGIEKLDKYINNENLTQYKYYTLESITELLNIFGNPHYNFKSIHIAGTNGKGSVAYYLNNIMINSGYKTALFTSPHLLKINERIRVNNADIENTLLDRYIDETVEVIDRTGTLKPTFFDIITLIAFRYFSDIKADIAVIETGLGGRLDSTNIITPLCSVITDISYDHSQTLGKSIEEITSQKAGIIKSNIAAVTSNNDPGILKLLEERSSRCKSRLYIFNRDFSVEVISPIDSGYTFNYILKYNDKINRINNVIINSTADFQIKNSSLAITCGLLVSNEMKNITPDTVRAGIKDTTIPGRFQILKEDPAVIFDPAHNEEALSAIIKALRKRFEDKKLFIIISLMKDKNYREIINKILEMKAPIIYYELDDERCYKPSLEQSTDKFYAIVNNEIKMTEILDEIIADNILFFFTGSFRLYKIAINYAGKR